MIQDVIQDKMEQIGYRAKTVSIEHLTEVQEAVAKLIRQGMISEQLHSTWHFYMQTNENLPKAKTMIIVAMPQPLIRIWFTWQGKTYPADIPPDYFSKTDYEFRAEDILKTVLETAGYKVIKARLALKTLAVRSGLAAYGRNNITYISGMGSLYSLVCFYTDYPCEEDNWHKIKVMVECEKCSICRDSCPTGSIPVDRFLIRGENCLGSLSEKKPDFPFWAQLQPEWNNALIGCMRCQSVCPVNKALLSKIVTGPIFSEEETFLILNKTPLENLSQDTRTKLKIPGGVYSLLASNLRALIVKQRKTSGK